MMLEDDNDRQELMCLQQSLQSLVAKLSDDCHYSPTSVCHSAHLVADDAVQPSESPEAVYSATPFILTMTTTTMTTRPTTLGISAPLGSGVGKPTASRSRPS
jgi:hypothetical protein